MELLEANVTVAIITELSQTGDKAVPSSSDSGTVRI